MGDEARARAFLRMHPEEPIQRESHAWHLLQAFAAVRAAVRESALREAADAVNAICAPTETTSSNIGQEIGLCRAEQAIRALLALPPPPTKGPPDDH